MSMDWTWLRFADLGVDNLHDALQLRCRVFILEQGPTSMSTASTASRGTCSAVTTPARSSPICASSIPP